MLTRDAGAGVLGSGGGYAAGGGSDAGLLNDPLGVI